RLRSISAPVLSSASVVSRLRFCRDGATPGRSSSSESGRIALGSHKKQTHNSDYDLRQPRPEWGAGREPRDNRGRQKNGREESMSAGDAKPFGGTIGKTVKDSRPWWPTAKKPPAGAPNILVVLFDDVGFSDFGCYGSRIRTPTIDALAVEGLRYTGFHTTAMCSTTRAALLTGRN